SYTSAEENADGLGGKSLLDVAVSCSKNHRIQEVIMETVLQAFPFNQQDKDFALYQACQEMNLGGVKALVNHGATLAYLSKEAGNALVVVCLLGKPSPQVSVIVRWLLKTKDVEKYLNEGWDKETPLSALHEASCKNNIEIICMLIEQGAWVESPEPKHQKTTTPLMMASYQMQHDAMLVLLQHGANTLACDQQGRNALHYLSDGDVLFDAEDEEEFLRMKPCALTLIKHGALLNEQDKD